MLVGVSPSRFDKGQFAFIDASRGTKGALFSKLLMDLANKTGIRLENKNVIERAVPYLKTYAATRALLLLNPNKYCDQNFKDEQQVEHCQKYYRPLGNRLKVWPRIHATASLDRFLDYTLNPDIPYQDYLPQQQAIESLNPKELFLIMPEKNGHLTMQHLGDTYQPQQVFCIR